MLEDLIIAVLPQMPVVAVILAIGMVVRKDVNDHLDYLEHLVDGLIEIVTRDKPDIRPK